MNSDIFRSLAYGMFVHYGLYSIPARGEWVMSKERIPAAEYLKLADQFHCEPGMVRKWCELAVSGGMKYMCLTTRHHDGFFIGDQLLREYCDTCREFGLGVGLYYSVGDWSDTDFGQGPDAPHWARFVEKTHRQLKELMINYGEIDYLFYDGCPPPQFWRAEELHRELRQLQPGLLISDRCGLEEDVASSENHSRAHTGLWESCYTLNDTWGYNKYDKNWKTPAQIIKMLMSIVHNGGNLLLNIGPMADGSVQPEEIEIIETVGRWLKLNGEAVYNVAPHPFNYIDQQLSTGRDNTVYMLLDNDYEGYRHVICGIGNRVEKITILGTGQDIPFHQEYDRLFLENVPPKTDGLPRVLKLELDGQPFGIVNPMWPPGNFRVC